MMSEKCIQFSDRSPFDRAAPTDVETPEIIAAANAGSLYPTFNPTDCPHDCYRPGDCDGSCTHPDPGISPVGTNSHYIRSDFYKGEADRLSILLLEMTEKLSNVERLAEAQWAGWIREEARADRLDQKLEALYDDGLPMSDGSAQMTAAEDVLTWLLIEKLGCPDDRSYSPTEAHSILSARLATFEEKVRP